MTHENTHLPLGLDGLFPGSPLLCALVPWAGLCWHSGQVRVIYPLHPLHLFSRRASFRQNVQRNPRLTGHSDLLGLQTYLQWMHSADAFIKTNLYCIQNTHYHFMHSLEIDPITLGLQAACTSLLFVLRVTFFSDYQLMCFKALWILL